MLWGFILSVRTFVFPQGEFSIKTSPFSMNISAFICPCLQGLLKGLKFFTAYVRSSCKAFNVLQSNLRS